MNLLYQHLPHWSVISMCKQMKEKSWDEEFYSISSIFVNEWGKILYLASSANFWGFFNLFFKQRLPMILTVLEGFLQMFKGKYRTESIFPPPCSWIPSLLSIHNCKHFFCTYGSVHLPTVLRLLKYLSTCHCNLNPAPSCVHINIKAHTLLCKSPECLVYIIVCTIICRVIICFQKALTFIRS